MSRKTNIRNYNHPDNRLIQIADFFCTMAARDATDLLNYGFTAADLLAIHTARDQFSEYPEDNETSADYISNTQLRNRLCEELTEALRQICTRAQIAYGAHSSAYRQFALGNLSTYSPEQLLRASTHTCTLATEQLATLSAQGLTTAIIAATTATATQLDNCLSARFSLAINREAATVRRIELGNTLYALLVTLSEKGKLCYRISSEPKYRHYQITE